MTNKNKVNIGHATNIVFNRIHTTGEEIKNDLPNWLWRIIESEAWRDARDDEGKQFASVGEWLIARWPLGPAVGQGRFAIKYDELIVLCEDRPELKDMLVRYRPKGKPGPKAGGDSFHSNGIKTTVKPGNSRAYLEQRLQKDHPKIWSAYLKGEYRSARQAAMDAGIIQSESEFSLRRAKSAWRKMSAEDRAKFRAWLKTKDAK